MPRGAGRSYYVDAHQFTEMLGRSSVASKEFKAATRAALRKVGNDAAKVAKEAVMLPPESSGHGPHTGLRAGIAAGIKVSIRASGNNVGVFIKSTGKLAKQYDGTWRAPLFGDRAHWYTHKGREYFNGPISREAPRFRVEIQRVLGEAWSRFDGR